MEEIPGSQHKGDVCRQVHDQTSLRRTDVHRPGGAGAPGLAGRSQDAGVEGTQVGRCVFPGPDGERRCHAGRCWRDVEFGFYAVFGRAGETGPPWLAETAPRTPPRWPTRSPAPRCRKTSRRLLAPRLWNTWSRPGVSKPPRATTPARSTPDRNRQPPFLSTPAERDNCPRKAAPRPLRWVGGRAEPQW